MQFLKALAVIAAAALLSSCATWHNTNGIKQTGSLVDYLYPNSKAAPELTPGVVKLRPPVKVGIAFVPGANWNSGLSEAARIKLLERVRDSFSKHEYIGKIEIIPSQYLQAKGGFTNLEQVARMFDVEVVTLVSYDQVRFNDSNALSMLYWTIIGAYVIHGDQYDVQTMVDAAVFDVQSHKLLFRAPGTSRVKGGATMANLSEKERQAAGDGYERAVDQLIPQLQTELDSFRERIKNSTNQPGNGDPAYQIENKPGYKGGGDMGWTGLALAALLGGLAYVARRRS